MKTITKPKEHAMQTCGCGGKSCNGIIQKADPRKIVDGKVYKVACGLKQEKKNKEKKNEQK